MKTKDQNRLDRLGHQMKAARLAAGISANELTRRMRDLGWTSYQSSIVARTEYGKREPSYLEVLDLAKIIPFQIDDHGENTFHRERVIQKAALRKIDQAVDELQEMRRIFLNDEN